MTVTVRSKMAVLIHDIDKAGNQNGKIDTEQEIMLFSSKVNEIIADYNNKIDQLYKNKQILTNTSQQNRSDSARAFAYVGCGVGAIALGLKGAMYGSSVGIFGGIIGGAIGLCVGYFGGKALGEITDNADNDADTIQKQIQNLEQEKQEFKAEYKTIKEQLSING